LTRFTDPPLSTVSLPGYELGTQAARLAIGIIDQTADPGTRITLTPTLIPRMSTARPPADRHAP